MNFDLCTWKEFKLNKLFTIKKGKRLTSNDQIDGIYNYIGAIDSNNGVSNHIEQSPIHEGNTITLSYNGSVGEAYYQYEPYWATDDVNALYPKYKKFNPYIGFFICTILKREKFKYSYGRKWTLYLMNNTVIKLPALIKNNEFVIDLKKEFSDDGYIPDWQFMEDYIKSLHYKPLTTKNKPNNVSKLNVSVWKDFKINSLFDVELSKGDIKEDDVEEGNIPLVSSGSQNNGIVKYINSEGDGIANIFNGNKITVDMFCQTFYHPSDFYSVSHGRVNILTAKYKDFNKYMALFITTILNQEQYRFSYGRAVYSNVFRNMVIKLPAIQNQDGSYSPDWEYMEKYIKSLPYGDLI